MRNVLVIGGLVVVALLAGLWFLLLDDDGDTAQSSGEPRGEVVVVSPGTVEAPHRPSVPGESAPALPTVTDSDGPREYAIGDIRVRDHRGGDHKPLDIPPQAKPAETRAIPSSLTHEIAQKVKTVMMSCVADLPQGVKTRQSRLEGQILISIKNERVTVTQSTMHLRNMTGDAVEPAKQCIESKSVGLENAAPQQEDLDSYSINISFAVP